MSRRAPITGRRDKWLGNTRELAREIAVVLIGVLLALVGQQALESWSWSRKTAVAERNIRRDLSVVSLYALERIEKTSCANAYLAGMERAILTLDTALARRLQDRQVVSDNTAAVPLPNRPWLLESWAAAQTGQIIDGIGPERYADFAFLAYATETMRSLNQQQGSDIAIIGTAAYDLPASAEVTATRLAALGRLRASEITMRLVARRFLARTEAIGVRASEDGGAAMRAGIARCNSLGRA